MSGEIIAILAVGVALAGLILANLKGTEARLREDMVKLEGLLEGLREAITGRAAAR